MRPRLPFLALLLLPSLLACDDLEARAQRAQPTGSAGQPGAAGGAAGAAAGHTAVAGASGGDAAGGFPVATGGWSPTPPALPTPPADPSPPALTPCVSGWAEKTLDDGLVVCEPGPLPSWECREGWHPRSLLEGTPQAYTVCEPGPLPDWACAEGFTAREVLEGTPHSYRICMPVAPAEGCPPGSMPIIGRETCQPIGDPCPPGLYADGLPGDRPIVRALAGAPPGGDGSEGKPFSKIGDAVAAAPEGAIIAVGKGVYAESVALTRALELRGACVDEVVIEGTGEAAIAVSAKVSLADIKVASAGVALAVGAGGHVDGSRLWIDQARGVGIEITGGKANLRRAAVTDTRERADGTEGMGVVAREGSSVSLIDVSLERNRTRGLLVTGVGATLEANGLVVRDTKPQASDASKGRGVQGEYGANLSVVRALVARNHDTGVIAFNTTTTASLVDVSISDTFAQASDDLYGFGLSASMGAALKVDRCLLERNRSVGATISTASTLDAGDLAVLSTQGVALDGSLGFGLRTAGSSVTTLNRATFADNRAAGLRVVEAGSRLEASDLRVIGTGSDGSDGTGGDGLDVFEGGFASLEGALFEGNRSAGVWATDQGTVVQANTIVVRDTLPEEGSQLFGYGIECDSGARVGLTRANIEQNRTTGIIIEGGGSVLEVDGGVVLGTAPDASNDTWGHGVDVQGGATLKASELLLHENRDVGLFCTDAGSAVTATNLSVYRTQPQASDREWGVGLLAQSSCKVLLGGAHLDENHAGGAWALEAGTTVEGNDVRIERTLVEEATKKHGIAAATQMGASLTLTRARISDSHSAAVIAHDPGTIVTLNDTLIDHTSAGDVWPHVGVGVACAEGAQIDLHTTRVSHSPAAGLLVSGVGSLLDATDVDVSETATPVSNVGDGAAVMAGGTLRITRGTLTRNRRAGVSAFGKGSLADLHDVTIRETQPDGSGTFDTGIYASQASIQIERARIVDGQTTGVSLFGAACNATDLIVERIHGRLSDGAFGDGIDVVAGSTASLTRALISEAHTGGLTVSGSGTRLDATDLTVRGTASERSTQNFGRGLDCSEGATSVVTRASIINNADAGVLALGAASITLVDAVVASTVPKTHNGEYGTGIDAERHSSVTLERVLATNNHVAGLLVMHDSTAKVLDSQFVGTLEGRFTQIDDSGQFYGEPVTGVADGIVVVDRSSVTANNLLVSGNARGGLVFSNSGGSLSRVTSTANRYGLVLRSSADPLRDATCSFAGNQTAVLPDADLPVPNAPLNVPESAKGTDEVASPVEKPPAK